MQEAQGARSAFCIMWTVFLAAGFLVAAYLPLFVDEAFYWQESRHPAWAYSDLPGLTAWLIRLGTSVAGDTLLGIRWPFLLLGSAVPWLVVLAARPLGELQAWRAGMLALLLPLSGWLGVLALPDVPMNLAAMACLIGGARAIRGVDWPAVLWLGTGLVLGGLSHYRFLAVIGVGFVVLLWMHQGRRALRDPRLWLAVLAGALAWLPLLLWNLEHGEAGWRFQLMDRHPWALHAEGFRFLAVQAVLATPLLFVAMLYAAVRAKYMHLPTARWFGLSGGLTVLGFFVLGFFADTERVSFHWPLSGYLALMVVTPAVVAEWPRAMRRAMWGLLALAAVVAAVGHAFVASPQGRAALVGTKSYPENFAGWDEVADAVRERLATLPPDTRIVVDNFKLGAQLGFAFGDPGIAVLDHPLNHHHGRARQLELWGLRHDGQREGWQLLVVGVSDVKFRALLPHYQSLCERFGALPRARMLEVDGGARRFALFALPPGRLDGVCVTPAIAHLETPSDGARVGDGFVLRGWAIKEGVGIARVVVLLDGMPVAEADYGATNPWVGEFLRDQSRDPNVPEVQFEARIDLPETGERWQIGLELQGADGSRERWSGPVVRRAAASNVGTAVR
ncbi:glycosyltransferase family 39 protein [Xanthomonadaceae bacterium JHOS43]|nr:glycosyltransferase family 39 protein [Xanthomonadaceae bacterium JHOS43]